jgi:YaiO family outer membrane protein
MLYLRQKILVLILLTVLHDKLLSQTTEIPLSLPVGDKDKKEVQAVSDKRLVVSQKQENKEKHIAEIGGNYDALTNSFAPWWGVYGHLQWRLAPATAFYGILQSQTRFALHDVNILVGGSYPLAQWLILAAEASVSPTALIVPQFSVYGQVQTVFGKNIIPSVGYRYSKFTPVTVQTLTPALEVYLDSWRFAYTAYLASLQNTDFILSNLGQISYYWKENSLGLSCNIGREGFLLSPSVVKTFDIVGATLNVRIFVAERIAITSEVLFQRQGSLFDRYSARAGICYVF